MPVMPSASRLRASCGGGGGGTPPDLRGRPSVLGPYTPSWATACASRGGGRSVRPHRCCRCGSDGASWPSEQVVQGRPQPPCRSRSHSAMSTAEAARTRRRSEADPTYPAQCMRVALDRSGPRRAGNPATDVVDVGLDGVSEEEGLPEAGQPLIGMDHAGCTQVGALLVSSLVSMPTHSHGHSAIRADSAN